MPKELEIFKFSWFKHNQSRMYFANDGEFYINYYINSKVFHIFCELTGDDKNFLSIKEAYKIYIKYLTLKKFK